MTITAGAAGVAGVGLAGGVTTVGAAEDDDGGLLEDFVCDAAGLAVTPSGLFFDRESRPALIAGVETSQQSAICFRVVTFIHVGMAFTSCLRFS